MSQIHRNAFSYFAQSLPMLIAVAALIEGLTLLLPSTSMQVGRFIALLTMAYYFHRHFLFHETLTWRKPAPLAPKVKLGWFLTANIGMILALLALGFLGASALVGPIATAPREAYLGAFMLILLGAYAIFLCLFGMGLPAIVARNRAYRLTAGLKASPRIALGLILGPGLVGGVFLALVVLADPWLGRLPLLQTSVGQWAFGTFATTVGFLNTILAVSVLCHAYRRAYPPEA